MVMHIFYQEDIRQIDKRAEAEGFPPFTLMESAGSALTDNIKTHIKRTDRIMIISGRGNNGGDGIVVARHLLQNGFDVTLTFPLGMPKTDAAKQHLDYYEQQGYQVSGFSQSIEYDIIIDAMLGIGTTLPLRESIVEMLQWSNRQAALRIAIDLPTGVQADHGQVEEGRVFEADYTFSLHGVKPSAFLLPSSLYYGVTSAVSIGLKQENNLQVLNREMVQATIPKRGKATHKGSFGTSLLLAGSDEMPGSALLAATGAIRSGTGRLILGTTEFVASIIAPIVPEATYLFDGLKRVRDGEIPGKITAIGIGPGIADEQLVQATLTRLLHQDIPLVVDAAALVARDNWSAKGPVILTPHPGEFSRLTGIEVPEIQANRLELARVFAEKHQLFLVLKGNNTVIACPDGDVFVNPTGNSGLAKGGSGDVLTGMIVSMLSTHHSVKDAVRNAVYIHGLCANRWSESYNEASMVASDFNTLLPVVLTELESNE